MNPKPWRKPYRRVGSPYLWARIPASGGANRERSLGFTDTTSARDALSALNAAHQTLQYRALVHAVGDGCLTVGEFVTAHGRGALDELAIRLANPVIDVTEFIPAWHDAVRRSASLGTANKYLAQVRVLMPDGSPFLVSDFTRKRVSEFLATLSERLTATNRYRAALSSFAGFLVERDALQHNPVFDVKPAKESSPRTRHLARDEANALISAIEPFEARAMHALMCGTGMELCATVRLRHCDVLDRTDRMLHARGTKREHRDRELWVKEPWCWDIFAEWLCQNPGTPDAPVFRLGYEALTEALHRAIAVRGITDYRTHDWRHTFAVQARRDGWPDHLIASQLGHKNSAMIDRVYGRFQPKAADYAAVKLTIGQTVGPRLYVAQTPKAVSR